MTEMEIVAKNMRLLRTKLDMSQAKLAEKVGVSEQTITLTYCCVDASQLRGSVALIK